MVATMEAITPPARTRMEKKMRSIRAFIFSLKALISDRNEIISSSSLLSRGVVIPPSSPSPSDRPGARRRRRPHSLSTLSP